MKAGKTDRRTGKGTLTRCGKSLAKLIEAKRPEQEVRDGLSKLQLAFDTLVEKHENYSRLLEDDDESKYSKRDAITFLRTFLQDKPLELIKGIRQDYDAAWDYLDSIYGDPRFVSDTITQDIVKFRALQPSEDARFCDLVHLVKRSFNTLKEVGSQNDMDNSHMLSIIEQKLCPDDRKVWSRDLERQRGKATLERLMNWMNIEMK